MPRSSSLLVLLATYNERQNVPDLTAAIHREIPHADILIIDDNSPDGTGAWCDEQSATHPHLRCLHRPGKQGLGSAILAGFDYGLQYGYEWIINMDADFSHDPAHLAALIAAANSGPSATCDVVIGSRYVAGAQIIGWPWTRRVLSLAVNNASRWLLGLTPRDCSGGFRCFRAARLERLDRSTIVASGYFFHEEILWRLQREGAQVREVPITFTDRRSGQSKISAREILRALQDLIQLTGQNAGSRVHACLRRMWTYRGTIR